MKISMVILSLCFCLDKLHAQTIAKIYARPYGDSIALRWQLYDSKVWEANIRRGYDIYRVSNSGQSVKLNDSAIKALDPYQFAMRYLRMPDAIDTNNINDQNAAARLPKQSDFRFTPDTIARKAMILQFPKETGLNFELPGKESNMYFGDDPVAVRWLFHSLVSLNSTEAAKISGLYFLDKTIKKTEIYTYLLVSAGDKPEAAIAAVKISAGDTYPIRQPKEASDMTNRRRSVLTWKKADTSIVFLPVYDIYRSESKNGKYVKMNKDPLLAVYSGAIDSTIVSFNDTTLQKGKTYYYKVQGKDLFGELTPFSVPHAVTEKTMLTSTPYFETVRKEGVPVINRLQWVVQKQDEENVAYFQIHKSSMPDTLFKPVGGNLKKDTREFIDKEPVKNNYYKLLTVGSAGDSLWSSAAYILVPDTIPPAAPIITKAICDSNGVVTIIWKHNGEADLQSFKIFRSNYRQEEMSRIVTIEKVDTIYKDTVSLETLTESIFYSIVAYDDSYNPSAFSEKAEAKRYDIIPPAPPVFTDMRTDSAGIKLTWGNSSNTDVIKTILYRKFKDEVSWHEYKVFVQDTTRYTYFTDTQTEKGYWYQYALEAIDDDGLKSGFSPVIEVKAFDDGFRGDIQDLSSKVSVRKGILKLNWKYNHNGVEVFQIYRSENNGPLRIYKSVNGATGEFYDTGLGSGNVYRYRVKAIHKDGGESRFSEEIFIQF